MQELAMKSRQAIKDLIESSKGQYAYVEFVKSDGSTRKMIVQPAMTKFHVKGKDASPAARKAAETRAANHPNLLNIWDVENEGIRSINLDTVIAVHTGGKQYQYG